MSAQGQFVCDLLDRPGADRGIHQRFPDDTLQLSLIEGLARRDVACSNAQHAEGQSNSQRLKALVRQWQSLDEIGKCPVVGITGLLNSGKSSLLASYLSLHGRSRVLRGTANNQGTHRFVLWLPSTWSQEPELRRTLLAYLKDLFGYDPEPLADDPQAAFQQYNGAILRPLESVGSADPVLDIAALDPLRVPLIASDSALDAIGLALLDCPDIQTAFAVGTAGTPTQATDAYHVHENRRRLLAQVGRLCSAFLIVSKLSSLHDATLISILETLRDTMPGVRRILAVNKVKARYNPEVVDQQAQVLATQFQIDEVYMAYDYRSHWAEYRLPSAPATMRIDDEKLPIFFRAQEGSPDASSSISTALLDESQSETSVGYHPPKVKRYLHDLAQLLTPGSLVVESRRSVLDQIGRKSNEAIHWFETNQAELDRRLVDAWQAVADACYAFMAEHDSSHDHVGLRLQTSPAIVAQMSDSLVRAAPWSMRASLSIDRSVRQLQTSIVNNVKRVRWLSSISTNVSHFVQRFRRGDTGKVVTADRFRAQLERTDRHGALADLSAETITAGCEQALSRFSQEDTSRLDEKWLDEWSRSLWANMSLKRKLYVGVMPLAPIFGPLLAVTMIPFDFGGSSVLVFASLKELALAAGISTLMLPPVSGQLESVVEHETALSQLGELFAVSCDSLGLERPAPQHMPHVRIGRNDRELPVSQLAIKGTGTGIVKPRWRLASQYPERIRTAIDRLRSEPESSVAS